MTQDTLYKTDVKSDNGAQKFSLYDSVRAAAQKYLKNLGEDMPQNLYKLVLAEMEIPLFEKVLEFTNGFETRTAKILGIARGTLRTKLKEYGIDRRDYKWPKYREVEEEDKRDRD